jgi:tetratricopeptide (TPR) repeat protein
MPSLVLTRNWARSLSFGLLFTCSAGSTAEADTPRAVAQRQQRSAPAKVESAPDAEARRGELSESHALEARGDLSGALIAARKYAEARPEQYFPRLRVAYLELSLKNYPTAAREYAHAATLAPKSIEALLGQQQALVLLGRFGDAEAVGRELLKRDPQNYLASSRQAWALFNLKRFDAAAKLYLAVLNLYPGDVEMGLGLGYSQLRAGHKREAADTFRSVLRMVPEQPRGLSGLAACR